SDRGDDAGGQTEQTGDAGAGHTSLVWLHTEGNKILHADNTPFHGRGANVFDTRQCGSCGWAPPHVNEVLRRIDEVVEGWHATFIRLDMTSWASATTTVGGKTINLQQWGNVLADPNYLADMKTIVAHIGTKPGVYVILTVFSDPSQDAFELPSTQAS